MIRILGSLALLLALVVGAVILAKSMRSMETSTTPSFVLAMPAPLPPQTRRALPEELAEPAPPTAADAVQADGVAADAVHADGVAADAVPADDVAAVDTAAGGPPAAGPGGAAPAEAEAKPKSEAEPEGQADPSARAGPEAHAQPESQQAPEAEPVAGENETVESVPARRVEPAAAPPAEPDQQPDSQAADIEEPAVPSPAASVAEPAAPRSGETPARSAAKPDVTPKLGAAARVRPLPPGAAPELPEPVIITRISNLRAEPGPDGKILAKVQGGAKGERLHPNPLLGYYRVRVGGQEGWLWYLNVADAADPEPPAAADTGIGRSAGDAAGERRDLGDSTFGP